MKYFKELLEKKNRNESILAVLFIVYLLSDMQTPHEIAGMIDTVLGKVAIMLGALTVFLHTNPIVGVLALLTAYEVIKRSSQARGTLGVHQFLPNEQRKNHFFHFAKSISCYIRRRGREKNGAYCTSQRLNASFF